MLLQTQGIYGLFVYVSLYQTNLTPIKRPFTSGTRKVYRFKKHGMRRNWFTDRVTEAAQLLHCDRVIACPSSTPKPNHLQQTYGETIRRTKTVPTRKYKHSHKLGENYETLELTEKIERPKGTVLLADDITTTGQSLKYFTRFLKATYPELEVIPFALGINEKLFKDLTEIDAGGLGIVKLAPEGKQTDLDIPETPDTTAHIREEVIRYTVQGFSKTDIAEFLVRKYNLEDSSALLAEIQNHFESAARVNQNEALGFTLEAYRNLYQKLYDAGDFTGALRAVSEFAKLSGLYGLVKATTPAGPENFTPVPAPTEQPELTEKNGNDQPSPDADQTALQILVAQATTPRPA